MKKLFVFFVSFTLFSMTSPAFGQRELGSDNKKFSITVMDELRARLWERFHALDQDIVYFAEKGFVGFAELMLDNFREETQVLLKPYKDFKARNEESMLADYKKHLDLLQSLDTLIFALETMIHSTDEIRRKISREKDEVIEPVQEQTQVLEPGIKERPQTLEVAIGEIKFLELNSQDDLLKFTIDIPGFDESAFLNKALTIEDLVSGAFNVWGDPVAKKALDELFNNTTTIPLYLLDKEEIREKYEFQWGIKIIKIARGINRFSDTLFIPIVYPIGTEAFQKHATYVRARRKSQ